MYMYLRPGNLRAWESGNLGIFGGGGVSLPGGFAKSPSPGGFHTLLGVGTALQIVLVPCVSSGPSKCC